MTPEQFNKDCVRQLEAAKFQGRIAIIGSGPSNPFVAPLKTLTQLLEAECDVKKSVDEQFWGFCERAWTANAPKYYKVIEDSYGSTPHWDARAYRHLAAIRFKSYVTLNYDDKMPAAFRDSHPDDYNELFSVYPVRLNGAYITAAAADLCGHKQRLVAIHGYCDQDNPDWSKQIILKASDYDKHYVNPDTNYFLFNWWKNLLAAHSCVFIGTSLQEPGLARVVESLLKDNNVKFKELDHIHLKEFDRFEKEPFYSPSGTSLGAFRQIPFDKIDPRYTGLLNILSKFSDIDPKNPSPGMLAPRAITAAEDFKFKNV